MNFKLLARSLGVMLMLLAAAMGICLGLSLLIPTGERYNGSIETMGWAYSCAITAGGAIAFILLGQRRKRRAMLRKDAIGIVGTGWVICSLFCTVPYLLCSTGLPWDKALFEAVSGLTTTGATVFEDLSKVPKSILLWRSITQWIGGMGVLAMFVVVLSGLGASGRSLFRSESSAHGSDLAGRTLRETTRSLWLLYISLTVICGLGYWALGMTPFQSINHALTTTSTAGFSTETASFSAPGFHAGIKLWCTLFMLLCGISLPLLVAVIKKREVGLLRRHEETWWYFGIVGASIIGLVALRNFAEGFSDWGGETVDTIFTVVSMVTTSGFTTGDYDAWPAAAKGIILIVMLIGACAGSTAGGLKVSRFLIWMRMMRIELIRAFRPEQVLPLTVNGHKVPDGTRGQLFVILSGAVFMGAISSFAVCAFEPDHSLQGCVSAVLACLSNVGPAFAEFGPTRNFADMSTFTTLLLPALMIFGRLEYIAVFVLLSRRLWAKY